jgi:hypothetical protein
MLDALKNDGSGEVARAFVEEHILHSIASWMESSLRQLQQDAELTRRQAKTILLGLKQALKVLNELGTSPETHEKWATPPYNLASRFCLLLNVDRSKVKTASHFVACMLVCRICQHEHWLVVVVTENNCF